MNTPRDPHYTQPQRLDSCPYLGSLEDPAIHFGYPTSGNGCYRAKPIELIRISYQDSICLTSNYRQCPVYQTDWQGSLPQEIRWPDKARPPFYWVRMALLIVLAICALILVIWFGSQMLAGRRFIQEPLNRQALSLLSNFHVFEIVNPQHLFTSIAGKLNQLF